MPRRYSEQEIDEAVLASQDRRHEARLADPSWQLVEADDGLGGLVWRQTKEPDPAGSPAVAAGPPSGPTR